MRLHNRMKVLLVRDTETTKSAATLYVRSGSLNDPEEVQGIAHFCEHMLFMGSEKFPGISEYTDFSQSRGNSQNLAHCISVPLIPVLSDNRCTHFIEGTCFTYMRDAALKC